LKQQLDTPNNGADILRELLVYTQDKHRRGHDQFPVLGMLRRMIKRVGSGKTTEAELLIRALIALEQKESHQKYEALELAVRDKRELSKFFKEAIEQAIAERDAMALIKLRRLQSLLDTPPSTTRTISVETVNEAVKVLEIKDEHPEWTYEKISTELYGDPSHAERLRKSVQRMRKAKRRSA
jgi:hypothetical protein